MKDGLDKAFESNLKEAELRHAADLAKGHAIMGVLNEACKTAIAINGGAAVAMGALLQAIVDRPSLAPVRVALLWGIAITGAGVLFAASTLLFRYFALLRSEYHPIYGNNWGLAALIAGVASLLTFLVGVAIPVIAGFLKT